MFNIAKPFTAVVLSASILCATPGFSAGIGGNSSSSAYEMATKNLVLPVKQKHKRRDPKPGEVIAGAILLGILGVAAAANSNNRDNGRYTTTQERRMKAANNACRKSARQWFQKRFPAKPRVNTLHLTFNGNNRYSVDGIVSNRNDRNRHRFHCNTRNGNVRKFSVK